jgi:hypothetical protein
MPNLMPFRTKGARTAEMIFTFLEGIGGPPGESRFGSERVGGGVLCSLNGIGFFQVLQVLLTG